MAIRPGILARRTARLLAFATGTFLASTPVVASPGSAVGAALNAAPGRASALALLAQSSGSRAASPSKTPGKAPAKKKAASKRKSRRTRQRGQKAPTPERITQIQAALARMGHYQGEPTGKWDAPTVEALKAFQAANRFEPTGKLDARTLQKLGLGSQVAGVAAPRPNGSSPTSPPRDRR